MTIGSDEIELYKFGRNRPLDTKYMMYKKINLFAGEAADEAFSEDEVDILVKLWCKERSTPWKLSVHDVTTLIEFSERIVAWRKNRRREKTRIRIERLRKKLRDEAENGQAEAVEKLQKIQKAAAINSKEYRKRKRAKIAQGQL